MPLHSFTDFQRLRATTAAPTYFKSFFHEATKTTFNDGGIKHNNPVFVANREREILWPKLAQQDPDLLLSIGTGFDSNAKASHDNPGPKSKAGVEGYLRRMLRIALDAIQDNLDCEMTWRNFIASLHILPHDEEKRSKYRRLNPNLINSLPKLDDVSQMDDIQERTRSSLPPGLYMSIADTLVATLFYFKMGKVSKMPKEHGSRYWRYTGKQIKHIHNHLIFSNSYPLRYNPVSTTAGGRIP